MKPLTLTAALALFAAAPAHADSWSPASLPDAGLAALVVLGFILVAGSMRGRKL